MRPVLLIKDAGYGETPKCESRFQIGDLVKRRNRKWLAGLPEICVVVAIVPIGFPPEYAVADASKEPRPLMVMKGARVVQYVIAFEGNRRPFLARDRDLKEREGTGAEVTWDKSVKGTPDGN